MDMDKKVIVIGASSGIGKALAKLFAGNGYKVGVSARRTELLRELQHAFPAVVCIKGMDLARPEESAGFFREMIAEMGGVDIVIISAGTGYINPELKWAKEKETISVNVAGFTAIASAAMDHFLAQGKGHLVGISSLAALRGSGSAPAYAASKAYVSNYLEGLRFRAKKASADIYVTDIRPGFVDTDMAKGEGLFWVSPVPKAAGQIYAAILKKRRRAVITKRWNLVAFLLSIAPDWLCGKV